MSGQTDDDKRRDQILRLLKELEDSAELNHDHELLDKIKKLYIQILVLETY